MREAGVKPTRREGERDGRWVLLDFLDVVVHVQHSEERVFYALDRLWKDCPTIPFVDASIPDSGPAHSGSAGSGSADFGSADSGSAAASGSDADDDAADADVDSGEPAVADGARR